MRRALVAPFLAFALLSCGDGRDDAGGGPPATTAGVVLRPGDSLLDLAASLTRGLPASRALPGTLLALEGTVALRTPALRPTDWTLVQVVPEAYREALATLDARLWRTRAPVASTAGGVPRIVIDGEPIDPDATSREGRPDLHVSFEGDSGVLLAVSAEVPTGVALDVPVEAATLLAEPSDAPPVPRRVELADTTRRVLDLSAPGRLDLVVARLEADALDLAVGVLDEGFVLSDGVLSRARGLTDGVTFAVDVRPRPDLEAARADVAGVPGDPVRAWSLHVGPDALERFVEARVDLSRWTGRAVELRLVAEAGPAGDASFDHAVLGELRLRGTRRGPPARPHVVLVDVDTLRADRVGVVGGGRDLTPRIDAWARRTAVVASDCAAPASWTLPSTASMLTGLAVHQHGVDRATLALAPGFATLAARLRDAGYETAAVASGGYLRPAFGLDTGFEVFTTVGPKDVPWDAALARLAERRSDRPTFLFLHTYLVHAPYPYDPTAVPAGYAGKLLGQDVDHANVIDPWLAGELPLDAGDRAYVEAMYDALVRRMDARVGAFLEELERALAGEPLLVVLTSDHGESFFEHDLLGHGSGLYADQLRVPFLLRFPDARPGRVESLTSLLDIVPTVLDVAGLPIPPEMPGRSLRGPPPGGPRVRVAEMSDGTRAVTSDGTKLLERPEEAGGRRFELYDLRADPRELRDLSEQDPARVAALRERGAWFVGAHPPVAGAGTGSALDDEVSEQLRALGYLGDR